jgi:hypothetical protein
VNPAAKPLNRTGRQNSKTRTVNSLNHQYPQSIIRFLIEKPAVVFIGEARENQLPISFS